MNLDLKKVKEKSFMVTKSFIAWPKKHKKITLAIILAVVVIGIPIYIIAQAGLRTYQTFKTLKQAGYQVQAALVNQDLDALEASLLSSQKAIKNSQKAFGFFSPAKKLPGIGNYITDGQKLLAGADKLTESGLILTRSLLPHADLLGLKGKGSFKGGTIQERLIILTETLEKQKGDIRKMADTFDQGYQLIKQVKADNYPEEFKGVKIRSSLIEGQTKLSQAKEVVDKLPDIVGILPYLLGNNQEMKYLVLLQNDAEIRPTGGFITAYANIKLKRALITGSFSQDIYALDRQFRSHIPAPIPVKEYLVNIPYWHLRDMNLSPDFKVSMETFYPNYIKVAEPADVVIALDTQFLTKILSIIGDISLPGYGTFSAKHDKDCNCPQAIFKLEQIVDTPRSTIVKGRKSVLGPLMRSIIDKTLSASKDKWPILIQSFYDLANQKHILFYSTNQQVQKVAEDLNFAGRVLPAPETSDYLLVVDANMGGAKSNLYIEEEVNQEYKMENGKIIKTLSISYKNPQAWSNCNLEKGGLCLNGEYRDWLRIYLPRGSKLIKATNSLTKVKTYDDLDKTVFEAYIKLRPQGFHKISFTYELPLKLENWSDYRLMLQKQPGSKNFVYKFKFPDKTKKIILEKDSLITYD